jgi:RNase P subunit RPR2
MICKKCKSKAIPIISARSDKKIGEFIVPCWYCEECDEYLYLKDEEAFSLWAESFFETEEEDEDLPLFDEVQDEEYLDNWGNDDN